MSTHNQDEESVALKQQVQKLRMSVAELEDLLKQARTSEQSLRQSEELFRLLVSEVRDYAIFVLDPDGKISSWNTGAQLIKGYTADEIIGRHFSIFYPPADVATNKPGRALQIARRTGVYSEEGWRVRKDGSLFWASVVITALHREDGSIRGYGKVTRDLTERKQVEDAKERLRNEELQRAREQVARAQAEANVRLRDAFLSSTAHELRTPVTSLLGNAELLQRRFDRGELRPERILEPVRSIAEQARRLDRLTTTLLDFMRLEHGKMVLERVPIDVRQSIQQVAHELQRLTEQHTIALDLPASPLIIVTDTLRFEQALYNLVHNAIKYSPNGGTIRVTAHGDQQQVVISVSDEGVGIPEAELTHVFERFFRATNIAKDAISGFGLGLYLVKEFVTMHGGSVNVQSGAGKGTTVRIALPRAGSEPVAQAHGSEAGA